jgi:hypothetical protein
VEVNHVITFDDVLLVVLAIGGLIVLSVGILMFMAGGMSDAPSAGQQTGKQGCIAALCGVALVGIAILVLAGCTSPTVTKVETIEVKVPVAVQPIAASDVPPVPAPLPKRSGNLSADADTLLAKVCEFVGYAIKADPLLRRSAGDKNPPAVPGFPECEKR